jgi:hypothetical protein
MLEYFKSNIKKGYLTVEKDILFLENKIKQIEQYNQDYKTLQKLKIEYKTNKNVKSRIDKLKKVVTKNPEYFVKLSLKRSDSLKFNLLNTKRVRIKKQMNVSDKQSTKFKNLVGELSSVNKQYRQFLNKSVKYEMKFVPSNENLVEYKTILDNLYYITSPIKDLVQNHYSDVFKVTQQKTQKQLFFDDSVLKFLDVYNKIDHSVSTISMKKYQSAIDYIAILKTKTIVAGGTKNDSSDVEILNQTPTPPPPLVEEKFIKLLQEELSEKQVKPESTITKTIIAETSKNTTQAIADISKNTTKATLSKEDLEQGDYLTNLLKNTFK